MKILVVGLRPSKKNGSSPSLIRLTQWANYLGLKHFSFTNVYEGFDDQTQNPSLKIYSESYDCILALGQTSSDALRGLGVPHFRLPHPSGLNRQLNNQKYVHEQLEACKNYVYRGDL